jgi:peptidoglycan hydrolase CwlO-like protein
VDVKLENFGDKFQNLNTKVDKLSNKITVLDEKVDSVQSFTNDLHNKSSTTNLAISGGHVKAKQCTFESMLQTYKIIF